VEASLVAGQFNVQSTGPGDPDRRADTLERELSRVADDAGKLYDRGGKWSIRKMSSSGVALPWDLVLGDPTDGAFTIRIPDPATCLLARVLVKNDSDSSSAITLLPAARKTIDGEATLVLQTARGSVELVSDGFEWKRISASGSLEFAVETVDDDFDVEAGKFYAAETLTVAITGTMPVSPTVGQAAMFSAAPNANLFPLTLDGNGKNIIGAATLALNTPYRSATLVYEGTEWRVF
jgi:hypothetical protein